jgi:hypothetical protein
MFLAFMAPNVSNIPETKCFKHSRPEWEKAIREIVQGGNWEATSSSDSLRVTSCELRANSAAHEVDYFQFVAIVELSFVPAVAGKEVAVEFYGDAVGLEAKFGKKRSDREAGREFAVFAVYCELHLIDHARAGTPVPLRTGFRASGVLARAEK